MINVQEASQLIMAHKIPLTTEEISISQALGRVLHEELRADRDFPPYDRVTMDGIAINFDAYQEGHRTFIIEGMGAAGQPQTRLENKYACIEIMTGAILPKGANVIIPYERVEIKDGEASIGDIDLFINQNVHNQGLDRKQGDIIVRMGTILGPPEVGIAATVGKGRIKVAIPPAAAIISSGDELVGIDEIPLPHQIRSSNVAMISMALKGLQMHTDAYHMPDNMEETLKTLEHILSSYPVIILTGGVSKGKFDLIPKALEQLNVKKHFHRIAQRPGKPFWFGKAENGTLVFALPGNPVSSFMCARRYVLPCLQQSLGQPIPEEYALLKQAVTFKPDLTYFVQVKIKVEQNGEIVAYPIEGHGSGDFANLVDVDGFLELTRGKDLYKEGESYRLWRLR